MRTGCGQWPAANAAVTALRLEVGVVLEAEVQREQQVHGLYEGAVAVYRHVQ